MPTRHYRVYIARDFYEVEPTTLKREYAARRYGVASLRDANIVVEAYSEADAKRVAGMHYYGQTLTWWAGPGRKVPVQIPNAEHTPVTPYVK